MNQQEIITYMQSGLTSADIANLMLAEKAMTPAPAPTTPVVQAPVQTQPVVQAPVQTQPAVQPQPVAQAPVAPTTPVAQAPTQQPDFATQLAWLGQIMQQPAQQPPAQTPTVQNQPNITPANAGITPEEATKLFQAWSLGQATQNIELPPNANDVLTARFNSLYGVDTTKQNKN